MISQPDEVLPDEIMGSVIVVDDDRDLLAAQTQGLELAGFTVRGFSSGKDALRELTPQFDGAILSDVRMPHMDGLALFERVQAVDPEIPVILLTGHGDVPMAVQALKKGAYDFLTKPFPMDELAVALGRASQTRRLVIENRQLRALHAGPVSGKGLLGDSPIMIHLRQALTQVADADIDVLITGDTGSGKETAARTLHRMGSRRSRPFIHINCASLAEETYHAHLFGAEQGMRPGGYGTVKRVVGRLEQAHRGVVLFDDVDALSLAQQSKLLDVIESREIWPLGAQEPRALDVRFIATTKIDLREAVAQGTFRADLFYRSSGISIHMPSLAQRRSDVRLLFQHFLVRACARLHQSIPRLTEPLQAHLQTYSWPGNVRELEHFAERFALGLQDARLPGPSAEAPDLGLAERVARFEADVIRETLAACKGDAQASAKALGLARKTFYDKLQRHRIRIDAFRPGAADNQK